MKESKNGAVRFMVSVFAATLLVTACDDGGGQSGTTYGEECERGVESLCEYIVRCGECCGDGCAARPSSVSACYDECNKRPEVCNSLPYSGRELSAEEQALFEECWASRSTASCDSSADSNPACGESKELVESWAGGR